SDFYEDQKKNASDWIDYGWDTYNNWFDYYIWDSGENVGVVEDWAKDTFTGPAEATQDFIGEVGDIVTTWWGDYIYTPEEAWEAAKAELG
ncbi:unnamed protein product, partial [marine sediment metagenome]